MGLGWLGALLIVIVLVALIVAAVRLLAGSGESTGHAGNIVLLVLAVIGALAVAAALGMGFMHFGMMGGM